MNITKHFKRRYVQRIIGIENENEIGQYIALNAGILTVNISKMFEHSKLLYKGMFGSSKKEYTGFYIADNIIIVTNGKEDSELQLITLYRIDFNFPDELNRQVMKGLLGEIEKLQFKLSDANSDIEEFIQQKSAEIDAVDTEIRILQEQLEIKKAQRKLLDDETKGKRSETAYINKEIEKYVNMLCNSLEYKRAMLELTLD